MILDSNIVIEAVNADERPLRELVERYLPSVSAITLVEVLGFPRLTEEDRRDLEGFFALATILPVSDKSSIGPSPSASSGRWASATP